MPSTPQVIELVCDGKAEGGPPDDVPKPPAIGVLTLLIHRLCGEPPDLRIRRRRPLFLKSGTPLWRRVEQTKIRAADHGEAGMAYVVDTEGENPTKRLKELEKGRSAKRSGFPMAVGVCHSCVEAWLLTDPIAIQLAFALAAPPTLSGSPESLPGAPRKSPGNYYKRSLVAASGQARNDLSAREKSAITRSIGDLKAVENACPQFHQFANEVRLHIAKLFTHQTTIPQLPDGDQDDGLP